MSISVTTLISDLLPALHATSTLTMVHWTDAQLTRWFHDWIIRLAQTSGGFVKRDQFTTLANGIATYPAPSNTIDIIHVAVSGVPLIPSTTSELEALDDGFRLRQADADNPCSRWYPDKIGANMIGIYPVPAPGFGAGEPLDVIHHYYPCDLDTLHINTAIHVPRVIGALLKLQVLSEAYSVESDAQMLEVAEAAAQLIGPLTQATQFYYGQPQA